MAYCKQSYQSLKTNTRDITLAATPWPCFSVMRKKQTLTFLIEFRPAHQKRRQYFDDVLFCDFGNISRGCRSGIFFSIPYSGFSCLLFPPSAFAWTFSCHSFFLSRSQTSGGLVNQAIMIKVNQLNIFSQT